MKRSVIVAFILLGISVFAQPVTFTGLKYTYFYPIAHHSYMQPLLPDNVFGIDFRAGWHTDMSKDWHIQWSYPDLGFGVTYADLNTDTLGKMVAAYVYTALPVFRTVNFALMLDFSLGQAYTTSPFDSTDNPANIIYGTYRNIYSSLGLFSYVYFEKIDIYYGINLTHFSNGGRLMPNLGLNLYGYTVGVNFNLRKHQPVFFKQKTGKHTGLSLAMVLSEGQHQYTEWEPVFNVYNFSGELIWQINSKMLISAGFETTYNKRAEYLTNMSGIDILQIAPVAGFGLVFNKISVSMQAGYRVKNFANYYTFYQVYKMKFGLPLNFIFEMSLNTYYFNAQYVLFGLGYKINIFNKISS